MTTSISGWKKQQGFTLLELMIAVAVIGIISAVAYPSYLSFVQESRRAEGQAALMDLANRQERFFYDNRQYTTVVGSGGLSALTVSEEGHYGLSVQAATVACPVASCYVMQATASGAQAGDPNLLIDSNGQRVMDSNGNGSIDVADEAW